MDELEFLRRRVQELEEALGKVEDDNLLLFDMSPQMRVVIGMVMKRTVVTHESIMAVLYGGKQECDWPDKPIQVIYQNIWHLRRWLRTIGVELKSHRAGRSYLTSGGIFLSDGDKRKLTEYLESKKAA